MTPSVRSLRVLVLLLSVGGCAQPRPTSNDIVPNDNRQAAGRLDAGVLRIALEARSGTWRPEGDSGRSLDVAAFAEAGKPLTTPGPLIRVPVGTTVRATVRNLLAKPLTVYGLGATRGLGDSVVIAVGATRELGFTASTAGTFFYAAKRGLDMFGGRAEDDGQLNGVIVVDPPGAPPDRVMAMSWYVALDSTSRTGITRGTMTINGRSWPHTERLDYTQGDSVHWRVVNFTDIDHPMHLHGFYFRVDAKGDGKTDTLLAAPDRRMAVTEVMLPFQTLSLSWLADRPGQWIYHCHYAIHLSTLAALDTEEGAVEPAAMAHHPSDAPHQMFGLVMGIRVAPKPGAAPPVAREARAIRIVQREKPNVYGTQPGMSFVVDGTAGAADPSAMPVPGPMLVLERGQPVAITIVNASTDHESVHWHGVELESYPDGVPGWSGSGNTILPAIGPHDSLTVRWTPPRAGSFMYHSHFNEARQMGSGLYGPIVVLEPGERFDAEHDRILFFGTAGTVVNPVFGSYPDIVLNGKTQPPPMTLHAGQRYRFRLFNLAGDTPTLVSLNAGTSPVQWRAVAKDGYPLPASQATERPAVLVFEPGEIYDYEYTGAVGELSLTFGLPPSPPPPPGSPTPPRLPPTITVPVHVR